MLLALARVVRLAAQQFQRNLWLSLATITLLVLPLLVLNLVVAFKAMGAALQAALQDKIDVSIYFKPGLNPEELGQIREELLALPEIQGVAYFPQEQVLENFKQRHKNDAVILESLSEIGDNPFGATLVIKAKNPEQYPGILNWLAQSEFKDKIAEQNFEDHRLVIGRINALFSKARVFGLTSAAVLGIIALLIVINTVRVAVYTHRGEIKIMRLVGAGNWFIRGPFLMEAIFLSLVSTLLTVGLVFLGAELTRRYLQLLFEGMEFSLSAYFAQNALRIFGGQLLLILFLTTVSSFLAVRRYLKV